MAKQNKTKWDALSMKDRASFIRIGIKNGITDLEEIREEYNKYADGGEVVYSIDPLKNVKPEEQVVSVPFKYTYPKDNAIKRLNSKSSVEDFVSLMYPIVQQELAKNNYSMNNIDNVMRQLALESNYGRSTRGNGYNYAGIKALGQDKKEVGTLHSDGFYYRNFKDNADFANWYLDLLNNRYDALNASSSEDYINRLHDGEFKYSKDKNAYIQSFKNMKTLDRVLKKYKK